MRKNCVVCGAEFESSKNRIVCSMNCRRDRKNLLERKLYASGAGKKIRRATSPKLQSPHIPRDCIVCGKMFLVCKENVKLCSSSCRASRHKDQKRKYKWGRGRQKHYEYNRRRLDRHTAAMRIVRELEENGLESLL